MIRTGWRALLSSVLVLSACSPGDRTSPAQGRELLQNTSFEQASAGSRLPAFWVGADSPSVEWTGPGKDASLILKAATPDQTLTISQEADLPLPLPAATKVGADLKLENIQRGEKSWFSGRILVTYLDSQGKTLGETYTLDRFEGSSDWKEVERQFPVPVGAVRVRLELQLLKAQSGSLSFRRVSLRALDRERAQAWRKDAENRIRENRMASLRVQVEDAGGKPLPDAEVSIFMRRHAYPFGTAVKTKLLISPPGDPHTDTYRAVVENFFNYATLENELKAPRVEKDGTREALLALAWLKERGIARRGHVLTWPSFEMSAQSVVAAKDDPPKMRGLMKKNFHDLLVATQPYDLVDWDVVNEPAIHNDLIRILGDQQVPEWFRWAAADAPGSRLFLNENNVEFKGGNRENLENWIKLLQAAKAPIGGLGWQGHMWHKTLPSGQNILDDLDYFSPYGLPVQMTEYDTHERFSDDDEARFLDEFLTAWFSHPLTAGFIMWGFQDAYMWNGNGPLFNRDWSLKPSGKVWMELVFGKWWTEVSGKSDAGGIFETRAFLGSYDIEVRHNGKRVVQHVDLGKQGLNVVVRLGDQSAADEPFTRLVSSNPYRTGKLPRILPPLEKAPARTTVRTVNLSEGMGAAALVLGDPQAKPGPWILQGNEKALRRRDLYLRFDPGVLPPKSLEQAALLLKFAEDLKEPVRLQIYVLSSRFVPQGQEMGLDWQPSEMVLGKAPGRSVEDGEYRLGDASAIFLGEKTFAVKSGSEPSAFSSEELTRAVQSAGSRGVTLILTTTAARLPVVDPSLELRSKSP